MIDYCGIQLVTSIQVEYNALDTAFWALSCHEFFAQVGFLLIQSLRSQLVYKNIVGYSMKSLAKVAMTTSSILIH